MKSQSETLSPDLKTLLSAMPDAYLVLRADDLHVLTASTAYFNLVSCTQAEILGHSFSSLLKHHARKAEEKTRQNIISSIEHVINTCTPDTIYEQYYPLPHPSDASPQTVSWKISHHPVMDGKEKVSHIIHRIECISKSKTPSPSSAEKERLEAEIFMHAQKVAEANKHLHHSRTFLKNIIDSVADPIFVKDSEHRIIEGNAAMWALFGRPEEEIIGKTDYDFFPKEEADVFWAKDNEVFASNVPNVNIENFTNAAGFTHVISTKKACFNTADGKKILVGVIRDITEITHMQEMLRQSDEARLKSIMDHSGRHVYIKDINGVYLQVNRSLLELLGMEEKDVLGKTDHDLFPARYADEFRRNDELVLSHAAAIEFEEIAPENGEDHFYTSVKFPLYDAKGTLYAICGISGDITERKKAEAQLQSAMERLTESNIELERFAYVCSHDLQEPLRMISNYTQRLVKHVDKNLDDKGKRYVQYILDGAANARDLIDDVLVYARIGNEPKPAEAVDCNEVLTLVMKQLMVASRENSVTITHDVLPVVCAHRTRVIQLFQNLISNAIKFRSQKRTATIHISATQKQGSWEFVVRDNGIGIPDEYKDKIFIIFQRLNKRSEYPGTGIGLALCKKIVESYQGKIWLQSAPEQGSSFFFTLPALNKGN